MAEYVTIPLDIAGFKVDRLEVMRNGEVHIHVSSTVDGIRCQRYREKAMVKAFFMGIPRHWRDTVQSI
jgi:hypothetical protein